MKWIYIFLLSPMVMIGQQTAFWETKFYFEDGVGNRDTITLGHDIDSKSTYNPEYGEFNLKGVPWNSKFEVRATHNEAGNDHASPKVFSKKIIGSTEEGLHPDHNCLFIREPLKFFVKVKNLPLKISWNKADHSNFCNIENFMSPHVLHLIYPEWYMDSLAVENPNAFVCLSQSEQYIVDDFAKVDNSFFDFILEQNPDGTRDTIHGFLVLFLPKGANYSPCSRPVAVEDVGSPIRGVSIYPNPTADYLHLSKVSEAAQLEILSLDGRSIAHPVLSDQRIEVSALPAGLYFLRISDGNVVTNHKFMKQ